MLLNTRRFLNYGQTAVVQGKEKTKRGGNLGIGDLPVHKTTISEIGPSTLFSDSSALVIDSVQRGSCYHVLMVKTNVFPLARRCTGEGAEDAMQGRRRT